MKLVGALLGYILFVFSLFQVDLREDKPGDTLWSFCMLLGLIMMVLFILLHFVPDFFKS
jgi:hypothetical protein